MAADSGFDRAFVQEQITHHKAAIDGLKKMRAAAKDDDVQKDIDKTLPVLETHLSHATQVAAQLTNPPVKSERGPGGRSQAARCHAACGKTAYLISCLRDGASAVEVGARFAAPRHGRGASCFASND